MTIQDFDKEYNNKGGTGILEEFMENNFTTIFIGEHFGVSAERVKQWTKELFGINYDPRLGRKQYRIEKMIDFAKTVPEQKFREAYYYTDKYYHDLALAECYVRGIYK